MSTITPRPGSVPTGTFNADTVHSTLGFEVRYMGIAFFKGAVKDFGATLADGTRPGDLPGRHARRTDHLANIRPASGEGVAAHRRRGQSPRGLERRWARHDLSRRVSPRRIPLLRRVDVLLALPNGDVNRMAQLRCSPRRCLQPLRDASRRSQPVPLGKNFAPPIALVAEREPVDVVERLPRDGSISTGLLSVAARWRTGAQADSALLVDGTDVTSVAMRQPRALVYEALLPLAAGKHVAALASPGAVDEWTFSVSDDPAPSAPAVTNPPTYVIQPSGTSGVQRARPADDNVTGSLSLSAQGADGDVTAGNGVQATGDLVYAGGLDPNHLAQSSRNWIGQARRSYGPIWGSARFGYTTADFTEGAEFLTSGTARTGVVARAGSAWGTLSYYQPVDPQVHGVISASPENLGIRSAAFATPDSKRYVIRLIALRMQEPANLVLNTPESTTGPSASSAAMNSD